jgi:murein DD-endopeptidase MepM/ murein hydrolase activator NlpD
MGRGSHERNYNITTPHDHKIIESQGGKYNKVIDANILIGDYVPIDLSNSNPELLQLNTSSSSELNDYIQKHLHKHNAKVAYGGYLEVRDIYDRSNQFHCEDEYRKRNIHLGVDFWCEAGTSVLAVLRGKVHSFQNNRNIGDYGPTIILEHYIQGETFYSLYGHLSLESLENVHVGQEVEDGEVIGYVGATDINGDYAPHLHFQIIEDIQGLYGDYPGVSCRENIEFYKDNCPDPNMLIRFLKSPSAV